MFIKNFVSMSIKFHYSSTNFVLSDGMYEILAAPSGRVLKYDVTSNTSKVIMDELSFANGIVLSPDEDFLLVRILLNVNLQSAIQYCNILL